ncbi:MAG: FAD-binding oxidoreductase [Burkholderiales bacterium]|nr:MAG: FAD-binding oxidoreductase [Burkholderiales bacterium]
MNTRPAANDIVVVGAGIVGACCALALRKRGFPVHVIDRSEPGEGASFGNAGVISPWSFVPLALPGIWKQVPGWLANPRGPLKVDWRDVAEFAPWARRFLREASEARYPKNADAMARLIAPCIETYREYLRGSDADRLLVDSMLVSLISGPAPSMDAPAWRLRTERGAALAVLNRDQLHEIEPAVGPAYSGAVLVKGQARTLSPGRLCKALAELAVRRGARFTRAVVRGVRLDANGLPQVVLPHETVTADRLVLAAGAWSVKLLESLESLESLKSLNLRLPMVGERGYHLVFTRPGVSLNNSVLDPRLHFIVSSMQDGIRAAGTAEFARLDRPPDFRRAQVLASLTQGMLPDLNVDETSQWMGTRASFPDSVPVIGPIPGLERIVAAFGHSHWGMSMAPGTGLMVAAMIGGDTPFTDPAAYRPDRFESSSVSGFHGRAG